MEVVEENANKILLALTGSEMRPYSGEELKMATELGPDEVNAAVHMLLSRGMLKVEEQKGSDPYTFGSVKITIEALKKFRDFQKETGCE